MISGGLICTSDGEPAGFHLEGHAGHAEYGQDIVCAAASMLAINCVNSLEAVAGVVPQVTEREEDGMLSVLLPQGIEDGQRHDALVLLKALAQGFQDLSSQYPHQVRWK